MLKRLLAKIGLGRYIFTRCGHMQLKKEEVAYWAGERRELEFFKKDHYCSNCLKQHVLCCARCGAVIRPGDFIDLVDVKEAKKIANVPFRYVKWQRKGLFIGCVCGDNDIAGKWTGCEVVFDNAKERSVNGQI